MTTAAWLMLGTTWAVILFFTGRFFWMVLRLPDRPPPAGEAGPDRGQPAR